MPKKMHKKAVVLLSGGLDSATTLYDAKKKGYRAFCLVFDYHQRHRREIAAALKIARTAQAKALLVKIALLWKGSALLDTTKQLPQSKTEAIPHRIPSTYVPARNTIFLSFALSYAETIGANTIFIGANALDFSGYPDCRPRYYKAFNRLSRVATKAGVEGRRIAICTPLLHKTKKEIIVLAKKLGVPLELTWSCYRGAKRPCGVCDSCRLRQKGFAQAGMRDPLLE